MAPAEGSLFLGLLPDQLPPRRDDHLSDPLLTVVVLNRDGRDLLAACLPTVLEQDLPGGFEVAVADNGSRDGSAELVAGLPGVRFLALGANHGYAGGNNRALAATRSRYALLLNNDTLAHPGLLAALVDAAESEPRAATVQPKLVFAGRPDLVQNTGILLLSDGSAGDRGIGEVDRGQYDRREEVFAGCGAALLIRREALADCGAFDEQFFSYYEDTDLGWRLRLRGWRALYEPAGVVEHHHAATNRPASARMRFFADRNRLWMVIKNAPPTFAARSLAGLARRGAGREGGATPGRGSGHRRRVLTSFAAGLPAVLAKRAQVRRRRTVPDPEVLRWLYPRELWDARSGSD